jgi:hypothetical protein
MIAIQRTGRVGGGPGLTLEGVPSKLCPFDFAKGKLWTAF